MFVDLPEPIEHEDPWTLPFESRLVRFLRGEPRIAYIYERVDNSTFRYRVHNMVEVIEEGWPAASASYFTLDDSAHFDRIADAADVLVICRARFGFEIGRLIERAKRRGIPVIFDVDDFVFDTRYVHLLMSTLDQSTRPPEAWDLWFAYVGRMGATLRACDAAITTNPFLAERIRDFAPMDVRVVPNFLNRAQLDFSDAIFAAKRDSGFRRDGDIHIGYFSGSPTHNKDFAIAASGLSHVARRHPNVRIRLVGYLEPAGPMLGHLDRIDRQPFHDYVNLQRLVGSTEINIAPLQDNLFTNCKSELKYFEAAVVGTSTIAARTYTFEAAIDDGRTGRLAYSYEWEEKIEEAVEEIEIHPERYGEMAEAARAQAEGAYAWYHQLGAIRRALVPETPGADPRPT